MAEWIAKQFTMGIDPMTTNSIGTMLPDSEYMTIQETLKWIEKNYKKRFCFRTVYNWITRGRVCRSGHRRHLKVEQWRQMRTTKRWVIDFLESMI